MQNEAESMTYESAEMSLEGDWAEDFLFRTGEIRLIKGPILSLIGKPFELSLVES